MSGERPGRVAVLPREASARCGSRVGSIRAPQGAGWGGVSDVGLRVVFE